MKYIIALFLVVSAVAQTNNARMLTGVNYQTGTTYTFVAADATRVVNLSNVSPVAVTLPTASSFNLGAGFEFAVVNQGNGTATITCTSCTINGLSTLVLNTAQSVELFSDGINYVAARGGAAGSGTPGGSNTQVQFNNAGTFGAISNVASGSLLASQGASTVPIFQAKPIIDVRDAGIDCTGTNDSGAALNTLFGSITGVEVDIPYNCQIKTTIELVIQGQSNFRIRGMGTRVGTSGFSGPNIFGCNAAASTPVLYINRSGYGLIEGIGIFARGATPCNTSTFTGSIQIDSTGNPGVTTHDIIIDNVGLTTSPQGGTISGYTGIAITDGGKQNGEQIKVTNTWINCQNSANSIGINVNNGTSDSDEASFDTISSCKYGIQMGGNMRILNNLLASVGNNSVFGTFGAAINLTACSSGAVYIAYNEEDTGGPFIDNGHTGTGGCLSGLNIIGNHIGVADIAGGEYIIDVGSTGNFFNVIGNTFLITQNSTQYIIGSVSQAANHGPLGFLWEVNNYMRTPTGNTTLGINNLALPFQSGEYHFGQATNFGAAGANGPFGPNGSGNDFSSFSHIFFPSIATGNTFAQQSPFIGLRSYTASVNDDWLMQSSSSSSISSVIFNHNQGPASTLWFNWDGAVSGLNVSQLTTPAVPIGVTPMGTPGGTTYTYAIVAFGQTGNTAGGPSLSTNTGNATLNSTNFNQIQFRILGAGANKYCVWRTAGGATQGKIACVNAIATDANSQNADTYFLNDTGLTGDSSSLPVSNTTGQIASTVSTGLAPLVIASTTPVANLTTVPATYNHSGTQQTGVHIVEDVCTLGTSCSVTLTGAAVFTSSATYNCAATDQTGANAVKFAPSSGSAFALTGTGTDVISYICVGN